MDTTRQFTISALASEFDVTTRTIRFYEEKGLLAPQRDGQTRLYSRADRVRLKLILRGKRLGLSLDESRDIIAMYEPGGSNRAQIERLIERLQDKRADLEQQRHELESMIGEITAAEARLKHDLEALRPARSSKKSRKENS